MLSASHTLISLPLGVYLENPLLAFLAAFILHFLCDMILHWNIYPQDYPRFPFASVAIDVGGGIVLSYILVGETIVSLPVLAAIFGGNLPDILHSLWIIAGGEKDPRRLPRPVNTLFFWHHRIQRETKSVSKGLAAQVILVVVAAALVTAR